MQTIKILNNEQGKIRIDDRRTFNNVLYLLKEKGTEKHSFQDKNKQTFKDTIKNLHYSADIESIKEEIRSK